MGHKASSAEDRRLFATRGYKIEVSLRLSALSRRGRKNQSAHAVTQSEVDDQFLMLVPVFADFDKGMMRIGQLGVRGNSSRSADVVLPMQAQEGLPERL